MKVRITKRNISEVPIAITTEFIKLEGLLKLANVAGSGGMAQGKYTPADFPTVQSNP